MVLKYHIEIIDYCIGIPVSCWITWAHVIMMSSFTSTPVPQAPLPVCTLITPCTVAVDCSNAVTHDKYLLATHHSIAENFWEKYFRKFLKCCTLSKNLFPKNFCVSVGNERLY